MQQSAILNHSRGRSNIAPAAIYIATTQCEGSSGSAEGLGVGRVQWGGWEFRRCSGDAEGKKEEKCMTEDVTMGGGGAEAAWGWGAGGCRGFGIREGAGCG